MKNNKQTKGDKGQHWTPVETAKFMYSLCKNKGNVLEPTAGSGRFVELLVENKRDFDAVEIDRSVIPDKYLNLYTIMNFFDLEDRKYKTILGNPPYVNGRLLKEGALSSWNGELSKTSNLYLHTLEKCVEKHTVDGSEVVFIIPASFISGTSLGSKLRKKMVSYGAFTHVLSPDTKWEKASVDTVIVRWVRGAKQEKVLTSDGYKYLFEKQGFIKLLDEQVDKTLSDYFDIQVGAAAKKSLKSSQKLQHSQSFITKRRLDWYDVSDAKSSFPRWKVTENKHKILVMPGPTRDTNPFYNTLQWDKQQCSYHFEYELVVKKDISKKQLSEITDVLNKWQKDNAEPLLLRNKGRWTVGVNELKFCPLDTKTKKQLDLILKSSET